MPSLLKRGKKDDGMPPAEGDGTSNGSDGHPGETQGRTTEMGRGEVSPQPQPPARSATEPPATYQLPGTVDFDPPISFEPAPPPPPSPRSSGSLFQRALGEPGEQSADERDRIAAMEFEQAINPVLEMMRAAVPGANTPEEAARILSENQGEITPDTKGGSYVPGDAFENDARVYYRLLRRNYEKNPRPSQTGGEKVSHHLHGLHNKLPGTRGW
jgi:hypothetical protein